MTPETLNAIMACGKLRAEMFAPYITSAMDEFAINTPLRQAMFLAQIGHESGGLYYTRELWGPTESQKRYEGRADLGNTQPGDGKRFMGRGFIQITGRANYRTCGAALGADLEVQPELLSTLPFVARSAGWFWQTHGCNEFADANDFRTITRRINGGLNGYADRLARLAIARRALGI